MEEEVQYGIELLGPCREELFGVQGLHPSIVMQVAWGASISRSS